MPLNTKNILIVEDEKSFRTIYRDALLARGFAVYEAQNGEEGLRELEEKKIDLVILDVAMPKMGGKDFLSAMRSNPRYAHTPVIVATVFNERVSMYQQLIELGATSYLVKGESTPHDVVAEVESQLERASSKKPNTDKWLS